MVRGLRVEKGGYMGGSPGDWQAWSQVGGNKTLALGRGGGGHHDMSLGKLMNMNIEIHAYDGYTQERV